jgi:two-component system, OmpR family, sensor histidine kinase MprB
MTLRSRIALIAAAAVAVAVLASSVGIYVATARTLRGTVDQALMELALDEGSVPVGPGFRGGPRHGRFGGAGGTLQVVTEGGMILSGGGERLPVNEATIAAAAGERDAFYETVTVDGSPVRILTIPARGGFALQLGRSLAEVEAVLDDLQRQLLLAGLVGIGLAAGLGTVVSRRAVRPVDELTRIAEEVATTRDLTRRIGWDQPDEIGRLAAAFDRMLAQLEQARTAQEQLVADASHELRTPLTSLRTNIEVLAQLERLDPTERRQLVDDVVTQLDEFSRLIGALVELARGDQPAAVDEAVRLDELVRQVAGRLEGRGLDLRVAGRPTVVLGDRDRLERAVVNLLENARKYAAGGPVEVEVADGVLVVRDHGPGIPDADLPHVFDRFFRSASARGAPGSGLGLAIVRQDVEVHGGTIEAANAPGGGAVFTASFPVVDEPDGPPPPPRPRAAGGEADGPVDPHDPRATRRDPRATRRAGG